MHVSVLLKEAVESLNLHDGDIFLDGTFGGGGHSAAVAEVHGDDVEIVAIDRDVEALERGEERLRTLTHSAYLKLESFRKLDTVLQGLGISRVNGILFDLGISSDQLEASGRGFSFQKDEPLEMSMEKETGGLTAKEILNTWDEETLELILRGFGEEKNSRKIAKAIIERRKEKPFETTFDLVHVVESVTGGKRGKIHPATKTFQALRIAVNEELTALEEGLTKGFNVLSEHGRFSIITFHSLEDRIVKNFFRDRIKAGEAKGITKKPITPSAEELQANPRSRSAKLRVIEKLSS